MSENIETTVIDVERKLTFTEMNETAVKICQLDHEEDEIELQKKAAATEWGAKLKANQTQRKRLCRQHRDGLVVHAVECSFDYDYQTGTVEYYDIETGECCLSRPMTSEERQMKLFDQKDDQTEVLHGRVVGDDLPDPEESFSDLDNEEEVEDITKMDKIVIDNDYGDVSEEKGNDQEANNLVLKNFVNSPDSMNYLQLKAKAKILDIPEYKSMDIDELRKTVSFFMKDEKQA